MSEPQSSQVNKADPKAGQADEITYEAARDELVDVVRRLESGGTTLKESMELWERGEKLADICQRWLDGAKARIDEARAKDAASD
ncbi:exodeoxyribonuclease VII small subunit [Mariniluteicoccus flavus]